MLWPSILLASLLCRAQNTTEHSTGPSPQSGSDPPWVHHISGQELAFSDSYIPFLRYHSAHHCMETYLSPSRLYSTKSFLNKGSKPHPIPTPCYGQGPFHQPRLPKAPPALPGMGYLQLLWAARASVLISRQKRSERLQQEVGEEAN